MKTLAFVVLFLFAASGIALGSPRLLFSDITSGPKSGLTDSKVNNQGAIVTIWGQDLGESQGTSTVYVGDKEAAYVYYWGNADGTSGPADLYSYHKMQEISFAIPSTVADGATTITVKVKDKVAKQPLPFTVRPGNIFFVSPNGDNTTGDGSWAKPWKSVANPPGTYSGGSYQRMSPGDILYMRGGTYADGLSVSLDAKNNRKGTAATPYAVIAYPNERVIATGTNANPVLPAVCRTGYSSTTWQEFWHFSKISVQTVDIGFSTFRGSRLVGNEVTNLPGRCAATSDAKSMAGAITASDGVRGSLTGDSVVMLGNYIHDYGCSDSRSLAHTFYITNRTGSRLGAFEIGWSFLKDCHTANGLHVYDQGICGDWVGDVKIHDNVVINQRGPGISWGMLCDSGYYPVTNVYYYNNLIVGAGQGPPAPVNVQGVTISTYSPDATYPPGSYVYQSFTEGGAAYKNVVYKNNTGGIVGPEAWDPNHWTLGSFSLNPSALAFSGGSFQGTVNILNNTVVGWADEFSAAGATWNGRSSPFIGGVGVNCPDSFGGKVTMVNNIFLDSNGRPYVDKTITTKKPTAFAKNVWFSKSSSVPPLPPWDLAPLTFNPDLDGFYVPKIGSKANRGGDDSVISVAPFGLRGNERKAGFVSIGAYQWINLR